MDNQLNYYRELLKKYLADDISSAEANELFDFIRDNPQGSSQILRESENQEYTSLIKKSVELDPAVSDRMRNRLLSAIEPPVYTLPSNNNRRFWWRAAAAAVLIGISATGYWYFNHTHTNTPAIAQSPKTTNDVLPGGNKATLTLSNGSKIILDSARKGMLAKQNGSDVIKSDSGLLAYKSLNEKPSEISYNTLTTPRGGQYQLVLPDGTKVWLNAASSITFPTAFTGNERQVTITGEAYFEVVHNAKKPFRVKVDNQLVEDIGTSFNINSYKDEVTLNVTLLEGSVAVGKTKLDPKEQAQVNQQGQVNVTRNIDVDQVMAWKNGFFNFNGADLKTVLRQIGRWYDVDVEYEGNVNTSEKFEGELQRTLNLSDVLFILDKSKLNFRIEGKKLIVLP